MSEQNIYKDHYELQQAFAQAQQSFQNIFSSLYPLVAPEGVQLSLQEVIDLTVEKLSRFSGETSAQETAVAPDEVVQEESVAESVPEARKSRKA